MAGSTCPRCWSPSPALPSPSPHRGVELCPLRGPRVCCAVHDTPRQCAYSSTDGTSRSRRSLSIPDRAVRRRGRGFRSLGDWPALLASSSAGLRCCCGVGPQNRGAGQELSSSWSLPVSGLHIGQAPCLDLSNPIAAAADAYLSTSPIQRTEKYVSSGTASQPARLGTQSMDVGFLEVLRDGLGQQGQQSGDCQEDQGVDSCRDEATAAWGSLSHTQIEPGCAASSAVGLRQFNAQSQGCFLGNVPLAASPGSGGANPVAAGIRCAHYGHSAATVGSVAVEFQAGVDAQSETEWQEAGEARRDDAGRGLSHLVLPPEPRGPQNTLAAAVLPAGPASVPDCLPGLELGGRSPALPGLLHPDSLPRQEPSRLAHQPGTTRQLGEERRLAAAAEQPPSLLVFSGGSAFNGVAEALQEWTTRVAHVLPVSDNGGSTAEIVRVIGGPAIGDIRSRCLRLSGSSSAECVAVKRLLGHRLPLSPRLAKSEWLNIVEGEHELWEGISEPYKDTIRAFLVHFQHLILKNASCGFCFQNGSVGNFFFAGARSFFNSLDAAIFLFSRVARIPTDSVVLPCVCTNDRLTLGAELQDGTVIRGQNEISHPGVDNSPCHLGESPNLAVDKTMDASPPLPAPIQRVFYMSSEGMNLLHEVFPRANPRILEQLQTVHAIVYGVGSLFTSICPSLVLRGVGEAVAARNCPKILLLNGSHDRETSGMSASDFVLAICHSLNRTHAEDSVHRLRHRSGVYVTHLLAPEGGSVFVDHPRLHYLGISHVRMVRSIGSPSSPGGVQFDVRALVAALRDVLTCRQGLGAP